MSKIDFVAIIIVLVLGGVCASAYVGLQYVPWPATWSDWLVVGQNSKAPIEALALVVTPIGAVAAAVGVFVNMFFANRTLRFAQKSELANRFQKGAEMLKDRETVLVASTILHVAANEMGGYYFRAGINAMIGYLKTAVSLPSAIAIGFLTAAVQSQLVYVRVLLKRVCALSILGSSLPARYGGQIGGLLVPI